MYAVVLMQGQESSEFGEVVLYNTTAPREDKRGIFGNLLDAWDCLLQFRAMHPGSRYGVVPADDVCSVVTSNTYYPLDMEETNEDGYDEGYSDSEDINEYKDYCCPPDCPECYGY